jgi:hypothetical protein
MPRKFKQMSGNCQYNLPTQQVVAVLSVDYGNFRETLVPLHQVDISAQKSDIVIKSSGDDPHLETVLLDLDPSFLHVLRMRIRVPQDTMTQLFYQRKHREFYTEADSDRIDCYKGDNLITIVLTDSDNISRIRLDPGTLAGEYIMKEFSIFQEWQLTTHPTLVCRPEPRLFILWDKLRGLSENAYETTKNPWSLFYWILFWTCIVRHKFLPITRRPRVFLNGQKIGIDCDNRDKR